jgi:hypothetical protein
VTTIPLFSATYLGKARCVLNCLSPETDYHCY